MPSCRATLVVAACAALLLVATAVEGAVLEASWTEPTTNVDGSALTTLASYRVYVGLGSAPCPGSNFVDIAAPSATPAANSTVRYRLTGLTAGLTYSVSVTAVDSSGAESDCFAPQASAAARVTISISPSGTVDFGNVSVGSTADRTFTVQNIDGGSVAGSASAPAPFAVVSGTPFTLAASVGATQSVTVRFSPALVATATVNLTFTTADGDSIVRTVTGVGLPAETTPPTIAITTPTTNATHTTGTSPLTLAGTAADNVGVTQVRWANSRGGSGTASGTTSWTATGIALLAGANVLTVTAHDAAGNTGTATLTVALADTTAPVVSVTSPTAAAAVSATITVTASATDNVGVAGVQFKLDGTDLGGEDTAAPYSVSWNTTTASNGSHTLTAVARDAAGNSTTSTAVVVTVGNDATPPIVTVTSPASATTVAGTLTVTATATDDVAVAGVQFKLDGANLGAEDTTAPYSVAWNAASASNGSHTLTAVARDAAGNVATSAAVVVTVSNDTTAPVVSAVAVSGLSATSATVSWTTNELSDSRVDYGPTTAYGSSASLTTSLVTSHVQTLSGLLASTLYHYRVQSRDAAGNLATSGDFTFTTPALATTGLIAHWPLDASSGTIATDASGNGNAGTLVNGPAWTAGVLGQALAFDGATSYVDVPHTGALNAYPLTVAAWIKTGATNGVAAVVNKFVAGTSSGYHLFIDNGRLCAWYFRDASNYVYDGTSCTLATAGYTDNRWHHVAFVVDAAGGRLYVDGVQRATRGWTGVAGAASTTQPLHLGDYAGAPGAIFSGLIDDVRLYGRALSATEVGSLHGAGSTPAAPPVSSAVSTTASSATSITIRWTTNVPSTSQIDYGVSTAYGLTTPLDAGLVTSHAVTLTGLTPGTVYHFRVRSQDGAGQLSVSSDSTFRTVDTMPAVRTVKKNKKNWLDQLIDGLF